MVLSTSHFVLIIDLEDHGQFSSTSKFLDQRSTQLKILTGKKIKNDVYKTERFNFLQIGSSFAFTFRSLVETHFQNTNYILVSKQTY
jgi:hypothetical protein